MKKSSDRRERLADVGELCGLTPSSQTVVDRALIVGRELLDAGHTEYPTRNVPRRHDVIGEVQ